MPTQFGIKVWVAIDSTIGYFSSFKVYTGKSNTTEHGLKARIVETHTSDLTCKFESKIL